MLRCVNCKEWLSGSRWRDYVSRRLAELERGEGDFTGLVQPSAEVVERARKVSSFFPADLPTPSVVPSESGDVLFIWHRSDTDIEVEIGPEGMTVWAYQRNSQTMCIGPLTFEQVIR